MNVAICQVISVGISLKRLKNGGYVAGKKPKDGYWRVAWERKRGNIKNVSGILSKKEAESLAVILNALTSRRVSLLVKSLHSQGAAASFERQRKNQIYTGRSFARN